MRVEIVTAGMFTTIQDGGRLGHQDQGVPFGGSMDKHSARQANRLVGNTDEAPILEATMLGPTLRFSHSCSIAITGANMSPSLDGMEIEMYQCLKVSGGQELKLTSAKKGCRAYIAIGGHWKLKRLLGSHSTLNLADVSFGVLKKGQHIEIEATSNPVSQYKQLPEEEIIDLNFPKVLEVYAGPDFEKFGRVAIGYFFSQTFTLGNDSNRMGCRFNEKIKEFDATKEMLSSGVLPGTIQITNQGSPIVLMREAQTTGGYPRIAQLTEKSINLLSQAKPRDKVQFRLTSYF